MSITLLAIGDVMLGGNVGKTVDQKGDAFLFNQLKKKRKEADLLFINLEMIFSDSNPSFLRHAHESFRVSDKRIKTLKFMGVDIVNIGTNHIKDFGNESIEKTIKILDSSGIKHISGGINEVESRKPSIINKNSIKLGFLGYCKIGEYTASDETSGAAPLIPEKIYQDITNIRKDVDFVILSLHWGTELSEYPSPEQVEMSHSFIEKGADIILGHHPHIIQGIEEYKNGIIFYSLGNFIFDNTAGKVAYMGKWEKRNQSIIAKIKFNKERKIGYSYLPIYQTDKNSLRIAKGENAKEIKERVKKLSEIILSGKLKEYYYYDGVESIIKREVRTYIHRMKKEKQVFLFWMIKNFKFRYIKIIVKFLSSKIKNKIKKK